MTQKPVWGVGWAGPSKSRSRDSGPPEASSRGLWRCVRLTPQELLAGFKHRDDMI